LFVAANPRGDDRMTLDEWSKFAMGAFCMMIQCNNGFNRSKEDFIWFVKKAVKDKESHAHGEMYHCLLKMFVDADTNRDGLVSKASFSKLIDIATALPRQYGYPVENEIHGSEQEKETARQKIFSSMDLKNTGVITFDEWLKYCQENIFAKIATMDAHPILDQADLEQFKIFLKAAVELGTAERTELYWHLVELFTESDVHKEGIVTASVFPELMDNLMITVKKFAATHADLKVLMEDATKKTAQLALFKKHNPRADDRMCVDEWIKLAVEDIFKKFLL